MENCIFVFSLFDLVSTFAENYQISENNASDLQVAKIVVTKVFQVGLRYMDRFLCRSPSFPLLLFSRDYTVNQPNFIEIRLVFIAIQRREHFIGTINLIPRISGHFAHNPCLYKLFNVLARSFERHTHTFCQLLCIEYRTPK